PIGTAAADKKPQSDEPVQEATIRELMQRQAERALENVKRAKQAGVPLLVGTGAGMTLVFAGPAMHRELELLVKAGLTPAEALQAATVNSARAMGRDKEIGDIAVGKRADFVLLNGDPLQDIRNTSRIDSVFRGGYRVEPEQMFIY